MVLSHQTSVRIRVALPIEISDIPFFKKPGCATEGRAAPPHDLFACQKPGPDIDLVDVEDQKSSTADLVVDESKGVGAGH